MRSPYTQLYVHLVWSTWNRRPLLSPQVQEIAYRSMIAECGRLGSEVVSIGGVVDHVHLLVRFSTAVSIADLVKQMKGASSRLVTRRTGTFFKWQGAYGAFTVSKRGVARVMAYIDHQEQHHGKGRLYAALEPPSIGDSPA